MTRNFSSYWRPMSAAGRFATLLLVAIAIVTATTVAGCGQPSNESQSRERAAMVVVGTTKADLLGIPPEYRALHAGMEDALGRPVRFSPQPTGDAIAQQLRMGDMKFAVLTAQDYAMIGDPSDLKLVATAVNELGRTSRKAFLIARASDQRFKTVADCSAKRFAFGIYKDMLTDYAVRRTLEREGVPMNKLLPELLPPPFCWEQRLYVQSDAALKITLDPTVNAGVVDELIFQRLPATGGNAITGPSKDQFKVIGETEPVPEMVIVAGPGASADDTQKLAGFLLNGTADNAALCKQLAIKGFAQANRTEYDALRGMLPN